jgi:hypothetical protein
MALTCVVRGAGPDVVEKAGGLHKYMNRSGPIITDSGGFQVSARTLARTLARTRTAETLALACISSFLTLTLTYLRASAPYDIFYRHLTLLLTLLLTHPGISPDLPGVALDRAQTSAEPSPFGRERWNPALICAGERPLTPMGWLLGLFPRHHH